MSAPVSGESVLALHELYRGVFPFVVAFADRADDAALALTGGRDVPDGGVLEGARVGDLMRALGV